MIIFLYFVILSQAGTVNQRLKQKAFYFYTKEHKNISKQPDNINNRLSPSRWFIYNLFFSHQLDTYYIYNNKHILSAVL